MIYEMGGCGLQKKDDKNMTASDKKMKIAEHIEHAERFIGKLENCKALSKADKESLSKLVTPIRKTLANIYGK